MTQVFIFVCEAEADLETATCLADRVIREKVPWIERESLQDFRSWSGLYPRSGCVLWKDVGTLAREQGIRAHGHFGDEPGEADAAAARRALILIYKMRVDAHAIVLIRDDDGQKERRRGLEQARDYTSVPEIIPKPIVIGIASCKREAWVLAGYEPQDELEKQQLQELQRELGFDPTANPERLTGKHGTDKKSAKRVLRALTGVHRERELRCWEQTVLDSLRQKGNGSGLTAYLEEIDLRLVPLFTGSQPFSDK